MGFPFLHKAFSQLQFGKDDAVIQVRVNDPIAKRHSYTSDVASAPTDECTWSCSSESTSHLLSHYNLKLLLAEATMLNPTNGSNDVASCSQLLPTFLNGTVFNSLS